MTPEWLGLGLVVLGNVAALIWSGARVSSTVDRLDRTQDKLADTLDKLTELVAHEQRINAVQNSRLENIEHRVTRLEER